MNTVNLCTCSKPDTAVDMYASVLPSSEYNNKNSLAAAFIHVDADKRESPMRQYINTFQGLLFSHLD